MSPSGRRSLVPRRRRAADGEEEGSIVGDIDDDSVSEASAVSDGEAEASEGSLDDERDLAVEGDPTTSKKTEPVKTSLTAELQPVSTDKEAPTTFAPSADTVAMMNGLSLEDAGHANEELHFDEAVTDEAETSTQVAPEFSNAPKAPKNETPAQKSRREHLEYIRQRDSDPAFIPTRGGFFLHDDRNSTAPSFVSQSAPRGRGRGRGYNGDGIYGLRGIAPAEPSEFQWAHDLHDRHENSNSPLVRATAAGSGQTNKATASKPASSAPNRTFSFSAVLGNVTVNVGLPGMPERKPFSNIVKRHHTLLPQHRPPLRRDKPVRISIPDDHPRYIFPSTERSFIFIPRAMRPNQQPYMRGRGRGSFHGSRRTSVYGGSTYTPSIAMSRKSSFGGVRDNLRSPMGSSSSRPNLSGVESARPVVRLPITNMMPGPMPMPPTMNANPFNAGIPHMNGSFPDGYPSAPLPLYQPRPQKTVSLAGIESPASLAVKAPQQQQEQPFHQQMPTYMGDSGRSSAPQGTPLSHIPEGAIYAQPFQPFPQTPAPMFYPTPYNHGPAFYPQAMGDGMQVANPMVGMGVAPAYQPGAPPPGQGTAGAHMPGIGAANTMTHVANGMVYFCGPMQVSSEGQPNQSQFGMPVPAPMNPQAQYYYPVAPFYPAQSA